MHPKLLVKLSNTIGLVSIILLMYWIFAFISIEVFEFKIFRENMTETFYLSIVGILALLAGALMINVMFNLTRIAEKHNGDGTDQNNPQVKRWMWSFVLSFPVLFSLLFLGDFLSSRKKENMLIRTATALIQEHPKQIRQLLNYSFDKNWLKEMDEVMTLLAKKDEYFPEIHLIIKDTIYASNFYLHFSDYYYNTTDTIPQLKWTTSLKPIKQKEIIWTKFFLKVIQRIASVPRMAIMSSSFLSAGTEKYLCSILRIIKIMENLEVRSYSSGYTNSPRHQSRLAPLNR